jgi:hypothetical protein
MPFVKLVLQCTDIKFVDVEKQVTNITIKDAPCELSNQVICAFMQKFGDVVQGSLRRGMIKGTNIETGTRYMQLTYSPHKDHGLSPHSSVLCGLPCHNYNIRYQNGDNL